MLKKIFLLLYFLGSLNLITGCTSGDTAAEDGDGAEVAESGEAGAVDAEGEDEDVADFEDEEGGEYAETEDDANVSEGGDEFADDEFADEEFADEEGAGGEEFAEDDSVGDEFGESEGAASEIAEAEEVEASEEAVGDTSEEMAIDEGQGVADSSEYAEPEPMGMEEAPVGDTAMEYGDMSSPMVEEKRWVPVKKIADSPFRKSGVLANAVYLARPGDTVESVSEKIYGTQDKSEELYTLNSTLRSRGVKTGDKIYYNSPQRPNDDSKLLTFYEDIGLQPEVYVSQPGDNIRAVSKQLLGDNQSWKEVWATNYDVESKGEISEGTRLRYWSNSDVSAPQQMAQSPAPPPAPPMEDVPPPPPEDFVQNDVPPPPPPPGDMDGSMDDIPPPPPPPTGADLAQNDIPPPPPPPPAAGGIEPPPPPPPPIAEKSRSKEPKAAASNPDETMALGAAGILLLAAVALIVMIRKKKARRALSDFANTQTQTQIE